MQKKSPACAELLKLPRSSKQTNRTALPLPRDSAVHRSNFIDRSSAEPGSFSRFIELASLQEQLRKLNEAFAMRCVGEPLRAVLPHVIDEGLNVRHRD
jgi:hypothetical protein